MYKIGLIPGDGIGPEVTREAMKVFGAAAEQAGIQYETVEYDVGGDRYLATGEVLPDSVLEELRGLDAIYLGAIGHPDVKPGILEKGILLKVRFELDLYINLRPVKLYPGVPTPLKDKGPEEIDFIIVRENTEGLYAGIANVLTYAHDLWRRVFDEVGEDYPDIKKEYAFVDATTMWMVKNPEWFDVIVTCNMFGDIITDLGAMIQGGMGVAASGNLNPESVAMFEPIHGSAPRYTGKNQINPIAAIGAAGMMLDHLGYAEAATKVEKSISDLLASGKIKDLGAGRMGYTTEEVGDLVAEGL
ncbi:3-isopropylmalate dehydrogenase [Geodia barretti]|uniref:3-isopropylmalate dehydrogenase n=1 Tax=Geodia barretti TaxID=519541 RepID=A0AA35RHF8_GEOBA|nr:3-isopropylmalate dehydrogenase [Geodia barretti]